MTTLADFNKADLVDDVLATDYNELLATALRAEFANTETISATKELADSDLQIQVLTPSGADRTVELAPESTSNHVTVIYNPAGTSYDLVVKDDSGSTTYATLDAGEWAFCMPMAGSVWKVQRSLVLLDEDTLSSDSATQPASQQSIKAHVRRNISAVISGLQLAWNSVNSIDIKTGHCYAENGDEIDVTSAITKSGLSLSSSTWYHVYVYLDSGAPAAEVVTTAPAAWKGTAYSKTGDTSRRYAGSILTDGSGNVYPFVHDANSGAITYYASDKGASPFRTLSAGAATTATAVDCSGVVPVTGTRAVIRFTSTASVGVYFGLNSSMTTSLYVLLLGVGSAAQQISVYEHPLDSSQRLYYLFGSAPTGGAYIDVLGYYFNR